MKWIAIIAVVLPLQDPGEVSGRFKTLLEKAEKIGFVVPDLSVAVAELGALSGDKIPQDLKDRFVTIRAQSIVLKGLHAKLKKNAGGWFEMPAPTGKPIRVKIIEVRPRTVFFARAEGQQELAYADLDPEWVVPAVREGFASEPDAALLACLFLARAARWEAAFRELGSTEAAHPLAIEARRRGSEAFDQALDRSIQAKNWREAVGRLKSMETSKSPDGRLEGARIKLLAALAEQGLEHARKGAKGPMNEIIDLIAKNFADGAGAIGEIREATLWTWVTDPKTFRLEGVKGGPPWLLDATEKERCTAYMAETKEEYVGFAATIRFELTKGHGGLLWEGATRCAWVDVKSHHFNIAHGTPGEVITSDVGVQIPTEGKHAIMVLLKDGHYVIRHNGVEMHRIATTAKTLGKLALHSTYGKVWVDEVRLKQRE